MIELKHEKQFKLPKEFAEKWLEALRSGKYKQGKQVLKDGDNYCCLGVACETILGKEFDFGYHAFISKHLIGKVNFQKLENKNFPEELIGNYDFPTILAGLNDGKVGIPTEGFNFREDAKHVDGYIKLSFNQIADWIEDNVEFY